MGSEVFGPSLPANGGGSPTQFHGQWPNVANPTELPNVAGATIQDAAVEVGDTCFSLSDGVMYVCIIAGVGVGVWAAMNAPGEILSIDVGSYYYTQLAVPVEEYIGQFTFDGSTVAAGKNVYFQAVMSPVFGVPGNAYVRVYDMGPAAGPLGVPVEITANLPSLFALQVAVSGLQALETDPLVVGVVPATGQIQNTDRLYEVTVLQVSQVADAVYVGGAGLVIK